MIRRTLARLLSALAAAALLATASAPGLLAQDGSVCELELFTPADPSVVGRWGSAVAVDASTIALGAPSGPTGARVDVLVDEGVGWTLQQEIVPIDTIEAAGFGAALALDGDRLAVGVPQRLAGGLDRGELRVFTRAGGTWAREQVLLPAASADGDVFGSAVALEGDTLVIGRPQVGSAATGPGSVHVFVLVAGVWQEQALLNAPAGAAAGTAFGSSLALQAGTLVVGAPGEDPGGGATGAVHVFTGGGATWTEQAMLVPMGAGPGNEVGHAVALDGDRLLVGAPLDAAAGQAAGRTVLYERVAGTWTESQDLAPSGARNRTGPAPS